MDLAFLSAVNSHLTLYDIASVCGIPQITLGGRAEDWSRIRTNVDALDEFGLSWWTEFLRPICDEFVRLTAGKEQKPEKNLRALEAIRIQIGRNHDPEVVTALFQVVDGGEVR